MSYWTCVFELPEDGNLPCDKSSDSMTFNDSLLLAASGYQPLLLSASRSDQNWSRTLAKRKIENENFPKTMN